MVRKVLYLSSRSNGCGIRKPNVPPYFGGDGGPPPPGGGLPPGGPPPPEPPIPAAKPAWRNVHAPAPPKLSKRQRREQQRDAEAAAAGPSGPSAETRTVASWATWQRQWSIILRNDLVADFIVILANPQYAPTPTSQEAELVAPPRPLGLFGPRSPRDAYIE